MVLLEHTNKKKPSRSNYLKQQHWSAFYSIPFHRLSKSSPNVLSFASPKLIDSILRGDTAQGYRSYKQVYKLKVFVSF